MSAIKKFFQKKKADAKFKLAGPGHKLNEESSRKPQASSTSQAPAPRLPPSAESQQAAAAALARMEQKNTQSAAFNTSLNAIRAQVRRELEAEKHEEAKGSSSPAKKDHTGASSMPLTVQGVYFRCPLVGPEILSKEKWNEQISEFLYEQLEIGSEDDMGLTAALIIHSCNRSLGRERISTCVDTLCKYLENIVAHPDEEKYRKIRCSNRVYRERVAPVKGCDILLRAAGFQACRMQIEADETESEVMEDFLMFDKHSPDDFEKLTVLVDALRTAEPIQLELDRNTQVLLPSQAAKPLNLPPDFFTLSPEEMKRELELRAAAVEQSSMLRTKAMREREEQRERRLYRYTLIRIRFPDGVLLQGTFSVYERVSSVVDFVQEHLFDEDRPFILVMPTGEKISSSIERVQQMEKKRSSDEKDSQTGDNKAEEGDKILVDKHLVPNAVLLFFWEQSKGTKDEGKMYLKPDVMILVKPV